MARMMEARNDVRWPCCPGHDNREKNSRGGLRAADKREAHADIAEGVDTYTEDLAGTEPPC